MNPTLIMGIVAAVFAGIAWVQTLRLESEIEDHATFVAETKTLGEHAQRQAKEQAEKDRKKQEKANAENKRNHARIAGLLEQLRRFNTSGGAMSPAPTGSKCPEGQVCFDRAEYLRADGKFVEGARVLADEGTAVTIDLDTATSWAQSP